MAGKRGNVDLRGIVPDLAGWMRLSDVMTENATRKHSTLLLASLDEITVTRGPSWINSVTD